MLGNDTIHLLCRATVGPLVIGLSGNIAHAKPSRTAAIASFMTAYAYGSVRIKTG